MTQRPGVGAQGMDRGQPATIRLYCPTEPKAETTFLVKTESRPESSFLTSYITT